MSATGRFANRVSRGQIIEDWVSTAREAKIGAVKPAGAGREKDQQA